MSPSRLDGSSPPGRTRTLRVASLNIWNPGPDKTRRDQGLAEALRARNLDVVLLQEMDDTDAQLELFKQGSGLPYGTRVEGVAMLCRFKLEDIEAPELQRKRSLLPPSQWFRDREAYFCCATFLYEGVRHHVSAHHWDAREVVNRNMASVAIAARLSSLPSTTTVLCGGDFNARMDAEEVQRVLATGLINTDPTPDSIDYVLYRGSAITASRPTRESFPDLTDHPMLINEFDFLAPDETPRPALV